MQRFEDLEQLPCWSDQLDGAKFKKYDRVFLSGDWWTVLGVNETEFQEFEYLLQGLARLVWENELTTTEV